jgi:hypothetical protein
MIGVCIVLKGHSPHTIYIFIYLYIYFYTYLNNKKELTSENIH